MPDKILQDVLNGELELEWLLAWLRGEKVEGGGEECPLRRCGPSEFAAFFLSFVRSQTDRFLQSSASRAGPGVTPAAGGGGGRPHRRSVSDPTPDPLPHAHKHGSHSPARDKKRSGRKVKTKLFQEDKSAEGAPAAGSPEEGRLSAGVSRLALATSTPLRAPPAPAPAHATSPADSAPDTPRSRHSRASDTTLGDFLCSAQKSSKKKKNSKNTSDDSDVKADLDISSSEAFPEIGARKSNSLRSERRRIKPTIIDLSKKSISLNSFNSEEFQRPSPLALEDNAAFARSPGAEDETDSGFAAERAVLRRERRRLIEKFQSMSAATSPRVTTPTFKLVAAAEPAADRVAPNPAKVIFEDRVDRLARIYDALLENNLILTYTSELYFLLSLVLGRAPVAGGDVYGPEAGRPLASVHNAALLATRVLWLQRAALTLLLDDGTLRALAETRVVRSFAPDLAKCLLNAYGVRREGGAAEGLAGGAPRSPRSPRAPPGAGVVAWNTDTDNADNFPSAMSFQCFKKQRDMFYEIVRWYWENGGCGDGAAAAAGAGAGPSLRARVRALIAAGAQAPGTYAHLGLLIARHARASASGAGASGTEDSRLSKLQRRLTRPSTAPSPHSDTFTQDEELYRDLVSASECEPFRAHIRDALATELTAVLRAPPAGGGALCGAVRVVSSLARLLGLLHALPYLPPATAPAPGPAAPIAPAALALRAYSVPALDVVSLVVAGCARGSLAGAVPAACAWASTVDAGSLAVPYGARLLRLLRAIYRIRVPRLWRRAPHTAMLLRCTIAALFARPHVPQEVLYCEEAEADAEAAAAARGGPADGGPDELDLLSQPELCSLLPVRREAAAALAGAGAAAGAAGGARHVTPLRVAPSADHHLQRRLSAAVRASAGGGARRVLELAGERVAQRALHDLARALAHHAHHGHERCGAAEAVAGVGAAAGARCAASVCALTEGAGARALAALALRAVRARLARHAHHYLAPGALCPPAAAAVRALLAGPWGAPGPAPAPPPPPPPPPPSAAEAIIHLKEVVCQSLEGGGGGGGLPAECAGALAAGAAALADSSPRAAKRALLQLSLELCTVLACRDPPSLTEEVLTSAERVWTLCCGPRPPPRLSQGAPSPRAPCPGGGDSRAPTPDTDGEGVPPLHIIIASPTSNNSTVTANSVGDFVNLTTEEDELLEIFSRVASARNVRLLKTLEGGRALGAFLARLAARGWLASEELTERCVALYRTDWPQEVVGPLAACMREVSSGLGGDAKGALFLDFLADYCADLNTPDEQ